MAWDQLWIDKPHLAYALIGGFTTVFSLISLFVKEKLYIGEATVATIFGVIVGPHALNWFAPTTWGNTDFITLEISRIVLVIQIFAVAVELPKKYMLRHFVSVAILLIPVMAFGWLISSVFIWKLIPTLSWVEGLVLAACVTATDPVLASAVVGKGKFAKRVPGHLRNLLSAESGCNDGMAFPFAYLAINCIKYAGQSNKIAFHFIVITVLYECVFGCILGAAIGYAGRHSIKFAEKHNLIDRESFLSFYFVLALFCTGVGSIIGTDDLLVSFAAGTAFSWDGWFTRKTEESHVSNVIDLLINMSFFVYFGAIVPWEQFNNAAIGIKAWKLVILAILILIFRRLPIIMAMKPFTPDIRTWREALFCGHFGPIGVGAIFISILSRAELESGEPTPLANLPPTDTPHYDAIATIWPVTTFLVIASILVHGSSIAVFALGKRLNNMTITMSYTTGGNSQSWLQRLPRIESGRTLSLHKVDTEEPSRFRIGKKAKPAGGAKKKRWADQPRERPHSTALDLGGGQREDQPTEEDREEMVNVGPQAYQEGNHIIVEDENGEVIKERDIGQSSEPSSSSIDDESSSSGSKDKEKMMVKIPDEREEEKGREHKGDKEEVEEEPLQRTRPRRRGTNTKVVAYQLDDNIIVENDEGEVIRRYRINRRDSNTTQQEPRSALDRTLSWVGLRRSETANSITPGSVTSSVSPNAPGRVTGSTNASKDVEKQEDEELVRVDKNDDLPVDEDTMKKQLKALIKQQQERHHHPGHHHEEETEDGESSTPLRPSRSISPKAAPSSKRRLSFTGLRRTTSQTSQGGSTPASPSTKPPVPRGFLGPSHHSSDDDDEPLHSPRRDDDDDEEETEVERKRRLAALGLSEDGNDSDEEDTHASSSHGARTGIPPAIQEDNESDDDGSASVPHGITWGREVKKQH